MAAIRFSAICAALLLSACAADEDDGANMAAFTPDAAATSCEQRSFESSDFIVCRYDRRKQSLELVLDDEDGLPLRSFARLQAFLGLRARQLAFAMNAGMYDQEGLPIGLFIEQGVERRPINLQDGPGNFHLKPNGVFAVDRRGGVSVRPSEDITSKGEMEWATQSGPMLVIAGNLHPRFDENGQSQLVRNGVGVADPNTAYFVISEAGVSFGRFARFFRDNLNCNDALYLDGTVSSLWDPAAYRQDTYSSLGPMIAVFNGPASAPHP